MLLKNDEVIGFENNIWTPFHRVLRVKNVEATPPLLHTSSWNSAYLIKSWDNFIIYQRVKSKNPANYSFVLVAASSAYFESPCSSVHLLPGLPTFLLSRVVNCIVAV
jgi:hypothetical protein